MQMRKEDNDDGYLIDPNLRICDLVNQETDGGEYKPVRLCRLCSRFLPIDMFPKGPVRYLCRTHWSAQVLECTRRRFLTETPPSTNNSQTKKKKKSPIAKKPPLSKLRSISILVDSKEDAKKVFGQEKVLIGIHDVECLVGCNLALRLIPSDPLLALSNINFIICTKDQRKLATTLWKAKKDPQAYLQLLRLLDLK